MSRKMTEGIDYTSRDYEAYRELMLEKLHEKMPEYTDTTQTDAGIVILECLANGLDICSLYSDIIANDVLLATTQDRKMAVILARSLGYTPYNQTASITPQVFVLNSAKDEDYVIGRGTVVKTEDSQDMVEISFETVEDLIIPAGKLGNETDEEGNYLYQVNVAQGSTIQEDLLGSSMGTAYQSFKLSFPSVLVDSLEVYVDEGDGERLWTRVNTFLDNSIDGNSKVYIVSVDDFDNCYIEFGNNIRGKIPTPFENGIYANYRIGGGKIGNVSANTITVLDTSLAYVEETFNPVGSTTLGHEKETLDEIKDNAPAANRSRDRAVTLQDYADLIKINNDGIMYDVFNAKAVMDNRDALFVHIYYQMRPEYEMTDSLREELTNFFKSRVMMGTKYDFLPHEDYVVNIVANLVVDKDYDRDALKENVESYIKSTFFAPNAFTFGDEFVMSDLESEVKDTFKGIRSMRITSPSGDIITTEKDNQIITLGTVTINVI